MKTRAVVDPVTLTVLAIVAGCALLFGGGLKLPAFLQKKPPVAQLSASQDELAKAKAAQAQAEAALAAAKADQAAKTAAQLDYAQQMATGTSLALAHVPATAQTPEVKLAAEFALRTQAGFEAARGKLSPEAQAEIHALFDEALAAKNAEVETLKTALAAKDSALQAATQEKTALAIKIPTLEAAVTTANATVTVKEADVVTKTKEVADWAQKKAESDAKAGSLDHYAGVLLRIIIALCALYAFGHFLLPLWSESYPANKTLSWMASAAKNLTTAHT